MIRVKIDLIPFGDESKAKQIAEVVIANDGTGDNKTGNYIVVSKENSNEPVLGRIFKFPRKNGILALLKIALGAKAKSPESELEKFVLGKIHLK